MRASRIHRRVEDVMIETISSFIYEYDAKELVDYVNKVYLEDRDEEFDYVDTQIALSCLGGLKDHIEEMQSIKGHDTMDTYFDVMACLHDFESFLTEKQVIMGEG